MGDWPPHPPKQKKMLKTGEMLKMLKIPEMCFKKVLKTGEMLKMLKVLQGIPPFFCFGEWGGGSIPQKTFNIFNIF